MADRKRLPIIAGNWKMNKTLSEARHLALEVKNGTLAVADQVEVVICPPFTALAGVAEVIKGSNVKLGAQNCHWENSGAFTGEISPIMLKEIGCEYVIVGHSERRQYFGETDEMVAKKAKALLGHGLRPIICVGERLEQREQGMTKDVIRSQVIGSLKGIESEEMLQTVIAYEPVWAIGTGKTASPEQAQEVHAFIRNLLSDMYGLEVALKVRIQYGGSVKPSNIAALMAEADIDGALVGGASLDGTSFVEIVSFKSKGNA